MDSKQENTDKVQIYSIYKDKRIIIGGLATLFSISALLLTKYKK